MQIIIVQSEIEEAIRAHINRQINVREGMRIDIDLSATRGPEGFKATIDIVPDSNAPSTGTAQADPALVSAQADAGAGVVTPAATRTPRAPSGIRKAAPPIEAQPEEEALLPAEEEAAVVEATGKQVEEPAQEVAENVKEPEPTEAPKAGRSLFGALKTPVNA